MEFYQHDRELSPFKSPSQDLADDHPEEPRFTMLSAEGQDHSTDYNPLSNIPQACASPASLMNQRSIMQQHPDPIVRMFEMTAVSQKTMMDLVGVIGEVAKTMSDGQERMFAGMERILIGQERIMKHLVPNTPSRKRKTFKPLLPDDSADEDSDEPIEHVSTRSMATKAPEVKRRRREDADPEKPRTLRRGSIQKTSDTFKQQRVTDALNFCARVIFGQSMAIGGNLFVLDYSKIHLNDYVYGAETTYCLKTYYRALYTVPGAPNQQATPSQLYGTTSRGFLSAKALWMILFNDSVSSIKFMPAELPGGITAEYDELTSESMSTVTDLDSTKTMTSDTFFEKQKTTLTTMFGLLEKYISPFGLSDANIPLVRKCFTKPEHCMTNRRLQPTTIASFFANTKSCFFDFLVRAAIELLDEKNMIQSCLYPMLVVYNDTCSKENQRLAPPNFCGSNIQLGYKPVPTMSNKSSYTLLDYGSLFYAIPTTVVSKHLDHSPRRNLSNLSRRKPGPESDVSYPEHCKPVEITVDNPWMFESTNEAHDLAACLDNSVPEMFAQPLTCRAKISYDRMAVDFWIQTMDYIMSETAYKLTLLRLAAICDLWIEHISRITDHYLTVIVPRIYSRLKKPCPSPQTTNPDQIMHDSSTLFRPDDIDCNVDGPRLGTFVSLFLPNSETQPFTAYNVYCNRILEAISVLYPDVTFSIFKIDEVDQELQPLFHVSEKKTKKGEAEGPKDPKVSFAQISIYIVYYYYVQYSLQQKFQSHKDKLLSLAETAGHIGDDIPVISSAERAKMADLFQNSRRNHNLE